MQPDLREREREHAMLLWQPWLHVGSLFIYFHINDCCTQGICHSDGVCVCVQCVYHQRHGPARTSTLQC